MVQVKLTGNVFKLSVICKMSEKDLAPAVNIQAQFSSCLTFFEIVFFVLLGMYLGKCWCSCFSSNVCNGSNMINRKRTEWDIKPSKMARNTRNLIREVVENLNPRPNPAKEVIALSIGDPCLYGNIRYPKELMGAVISAVSSAKFNGYSPSVGYMECRKAVAQYMSHDGATYRPQDIILVSGTSAALEHSILLLADWEQGHNIIVPRPGFSVCNTIAEGVGIKCKPYNLLPHKNWIVDLDHLKEQIDGNTAAIVVNNPSNPCGSVYESDHLQAILNVASKHKVPIISDEIYDKQTWGKTKFVSLAALKSDVPLFVCTGISKCLLVPGWRFGWIAIHDPKKILDETVRKGLISLGMRISGANSLIQGALIQCINHIPQSYFDEINNTLRTNAKLCYDMIKDIPGLNPTMPEGAFYIMIEIKKELFPEFSSSSDFVVKLMEEESVLCLPGECFLYPFYLRIVTAYPEIILREACTRMKEFCTRHLNKE